MGVIDKIFPYRLVKENEKYYIEKFMVGMNYWYRFVGDCDTFRQGKYELERMAYGSR